MLKRKTAKFCYTRRNACIRQSAQNKRQRKMKWSGETSSSSIVLTFETVYAVSTSFHFFPHFQYGFIADCYFLQNLHKLNEFLCECFYFTMSPLSLCPYLIFHFNITNVKHIILYIRLLIILNDVEQRKKHTCRLGLRIGSVFSNNCENFT